MELCSNSAIRSRRIHRNGRFGEFARQRSGHHFRNHRRVHSHGDATTGTIERVNRNNYSIRIFASFCCRFAADYETKNKDVSDVRTFTTVTNPINAYLLIKRMNNDWKDIRALMSSNTAETFIKNITQGRIQNAVRFVQLAEKQCLFLGQISGR